MVKTFRRLLLFCCSISFCCYCCLFGFAWINCFVFTFAFNFCCCLVGNWTVVFGFWFTFCGIVRYTCSLLRIQSFFNYSSFLFNVLKGKRQFSQVITVLSTGIWTSVTVICFILCWLDDYGHQKVVCRSLGIMVHEKSLTIVLWFTSWFRLILLDHIYCVFFEIGH